MPAVGAVGQIAAEHYTIRFAAFAVARGDIGRQRDLRALAGSAAEVGNSIRSTPVGDARHALAARRTVQGNRRRSSQIKYRKAPSAIATAMLAINTRMSTASLSTPFDLMARTSTRFAGAFLVLFGHKTWV